MTVLSNIKNLLLPSKENDTTTPIPSPSRPYLLPQRSSTFFITLTISLAIFTDIFYYALIVPVIPFALAERVGLAPADVQRWTAVLLACYSVALLVASPFAGLYADHSASRRGPLLLGLLALAGSTLLLCLGRAVWLLVLGRVLQGVSAAIVWSVGCALLVDTMGNAVGVAMGYTTIGMSLGLLIAPAVGGAVYASAGYYPVYYIAFGVVAVDILLRLCMIEKKVARQWVNEESNATTTPADTALDVEMAAAGANDTQLPALESNTVHNSVQQVPTSSQTRQDMSTTPKSTQQHSKIQPVIVLLKSPRLLAAFYAIVTQAGVMMGFDAVLALFVQFTFHWNSTQAGLLFLAIFGPGFVSPLVGWLSDKYGAKWPVVGGFAITIPPLICLRFVTQDITEHKVLMCALLVILGIALHFCATPLMAEISYVIFEKSEQSPGIFGEKGVYGLGYGLFTMAFALGGTVGPLWAGYVHDGPGWGTMTWSFGLWCASGMVVAFFWLGGKPRSSGAGTMSGRTGAE